MNKWEIVKRCRRLRKRSTKAEIILWNELKNRKVNGLKFLRQHPFIYGTTNYELRFFIADFYCAEKKIVIELDGEIHADQKEYDLNRDEIINDLGIKVVRFKNYEIEKALSYIRSL